MSRALLLVEPGRFAWGDVPEPAVTSGEVVVRARFTGLCGTDLHIADGSHPRATLPLAIGHEMVGVPESGRLAGRTVLVDPLLPCGACPACDGGAPNACARLRLIGIDRDGALAGRIAVAEDRLHVVPSSIPDDVAPLAEPIAVAVHVVSRVPALAGRLVVIMGGGPVGLLVAHVARRAGGRVLVAEPSPARRSIAEALGFELLDRMAPPRMSCAGRTDGWRQWCSTRQRPPPWRPSSPGSWRRRAPSPSWARTAGRRRSTSRR